MENETRGSQLLPSAVPGCSMHQGSSAAIPQRIDSFCSTVDQSEIERHRDKGGLDLFSSAGGLSVATQAIPLAVQSVSAIVTTELATRAQ